MLLMWPYLALFFMLFHSLRYIFLIQFSFLSCLVIYTLSLILIITFIGMVFPFCFTWWDDPWKLLGFDLFFGAVGSCFGM